VNNFTERVAVFLALIVAACASAFLIAVTYRAIRWVIGV
jgi:hypothetical protein